MVGVGTARPVTIRTESAAGPPPLYICGCPRSGTYLLQRMIADAFDIAIPMESHVLPPFRRHARPWGDLGDEINRRRLVEAILDFVEIFTDQVVWSRMSDPVAVTGERATLLAVRPEVERIVAESGDFDDIMRSLFAAYGRVHGAGRWGEKSSFFSPEPVEIFTRCCPDALVIQPIRDGRDVCLSWRRAWFGPVSVHQAARLWVAHVENGRRWGVAHPDRYMEVRYEDLVVQPDTVVAQIGAFLGDSPRGDGKGGADSEMARVLAATDTHARLSGGVAGDTAGKWRQAMTANDLAMFEAVAGPALETTGYELATTPDRRAGAARLTGAAATDRIRNLVNGARWKRRAATHLPLLLFLARRLGISLPAMRQRRGAL